MTVTLILMQAETAPYVSNRVSPRHGHADANHKGKTMNSEKYRAGMAVRREVLGDEYVDRTISGATEFTKPLQNMVTENCWGEVWTRGGC